MFSENGSWRYGASIKLTKRAHAGNSVYAAMLPNPYLKMELAGVGPPQNEAFSREAFSFAWPSAQVVMFDHILQTSRGQ